MQEFIEYILQTLYVIIEFKENYKFLYLMIISYIFYKLIKSMYNDYESDKNKITISNEEFLMVVILSFIVNRFS